MKHVTFRENSENRPASVKLGEKVLLQIDLGEILANSISIWTTDDTMMGIVSSNEMKLSRRFMDLAALVVVVEFDE